MVINCRYLLLTLSKISSPKGLPLSQVAAVEALVVPISDEAMKEHGTSEEPAHAQPLRAVLCPWIILDNFQYAMQRIENNSDLESITEFWIRNHWKQIRGMSRLAGLCLLLGASGPANRQPRSLSLSYSVALTGSLF